MILENNHLHKTYFQRLLYPHCTSAKTQGVLLTNREVRASHIEMQLKQGLAINISWIKYCQSVVLEAVAQFNSTWEGSLSFPVCIAPAEAALGAGHCSLDHPERGHHEALPKTLPSAQLNLPPKLPRQTGLENRSPKWILTAH